MTTSLPSEMRKERGERSSKTPHSPKAYCPSIPKRELEALVRCLLPAIRSYFASEEGQLEYAEWEAAQQKQMS